MQPGKSLVDFHLLKKGLFLFLGIKGRVNFYFYRIQNVKKEL